MSWSFQAVGSPEKVAAALEAHSEKISSHPEDYSRKEYDEAKPHLLALVRQNFVAEGSGHGKTAIRINASGSASISGGQKVQSSCTVSIESLWGYLG